MRQFICVLFASSLVLACTHSNGPEPATEIAKATTKPTITPENWPKNTSPITRDPAIEKRIAELLSKMSLEQKVGQVIQADIASITPAEVKEYQLGSVLNGGNSAPFKDNRTEAKNWLALADEFWLASTDTSDGGLGIPVLWGIDAVHGNNNVVGATVFPHNIGLGAANDPELMHKIGEITAKEIIVTGQDWTFAPTLAVVRNDRWGRTYESYSEDPKRIAEYAGHLVSGIQGQVNTPEFLGDAGIIATAKHFVGDGGTKDGKDQGEVLASEAELRDIHAAGYPPAIQAGAQVVMASYNSWYGAKMHGSKVMLTDVLVDRMGFDGFVVGDWNGHGQVKGCTNVSCAQAFNAGLDMFMAPDSWKGLYKNTLAQVQSGEISMTRLDQAVSRILRVKIRAGLFEAGLPSQRPFAGQFDLLSAPEHKAIAREAVRKSLVLLKNNNQLLPLNPASNVLVTGSGADDMGQQTGGWTLSWQGTGNTRENFPNGETIFEGIKQAVESAGGTAKLSAEGEFDTQPDVAIVVFGEQPYAEFQGDLPHLDLADESGLMLLKKLKQQNIPTVAVFLSGRPMWVNPELNQSDAFVAAWLPGTEGGGIADVLFTNQQGEVEYDFTGQLTFSWPATPTDVELNVGNADYNPLFAYGFGLSSKDDVTLAMLNDEVNDAINTAHLTQYVFAGDPVVPWRMVLMDQVGNIHITSNSQTSAGSAMTAVAADDKAQEDTIIVSWTDTGTFAVDGSPIDLSRQTSGDMALYLDYKVIESSGKSASFTMGCGNDCSGSLDVTDALAEKAGKGWQQGMLKLSCFKDAGANMENVQMPFALRSEQGLAFQLREVKVMPNTGNASCQL